MFAPALQLQDSPTARAGGQAASAAAGRAALYGFYAKPSRTSPLWTHRIAIAVGAGIAGWSAVFGAGLMLMR